MKDLDKSAMSEAIKKVIKSCGFEVLADMAKFQSAIRDFLFKNSLKDEQKLLISAIQIGVGEILFNAINRSDSDKERAIIVARELLQDERLTENYRDSIIEAFTKVVFDKHEIYSEQMSSLMSPQDNSHITVYIHNPATKDNPDPTKYHNNHPTLKILNELKSNKYRWNKKTAQWHKNFPVENFSIDDLKKSNWLHKADGVLIDVIDGNEIVIDKYEIRSDRWISLKM